jgi:hypothetical protein
MLKSNSGGTALATQNDIKGVLGDIDPAQMLAIISLRPSIADIEQASVWLEGDRDVFGPGKAVQGVASEIIAILDSDHLAPNDAKSQPSRPACGERNSWADFIINTFGFSFRYTQYHEALIDR